jgi:hypothetical protein
MTGTPYPSCEPADPSNACQACIELECCDELRNCHALDPYNVCGFGGPDPYPQMGGELFCVMECVNESADPENGEPVTLQMLDLCYFSCATPACGLPGDETLAVTTCIFENCADQCFY